MSAGSDSGSDGSFEGDITSAFWAIEVVPGKEYTTTPPYDIHLTSAVLPFAAKDNGRTVVNVKVDDKQFAISSLKLNTVDAQHLDLVFDSEVEITFSVEGKNPVHLSGYYVPPTTPEFDDDEDDDEFDEDEAEYRKALGLGPDDSLDEEDDEDLDDEETAELEKQITQNIAQKAANKREAPQQQQQQAKKQKTEQKPAEKKPEQKTPQQGKQQQQQKQTPKSDQKPQQQKGQQKVTKMQNGLEIHITQESSKNEAAQSGQTISMRYAGTLANGKKFDDNIRGPAFSFKLGAGEVIKGWDLGIVGMKVGEKRKLIIPPSLGYGSQKSGPIPANSTLHFDVELISIKGGGKKGGRVAGREFD